MEKEIEKIKTAIGNLYNEFFKENNIDKNTGELNKSNDKIFATKPFIGKKYGESNRVLFIGLDIGKDENNSKMQDFKTRYDKIIKEPYNSHIAGTYITALEHIDSFKNYRNYNNRCSFKDAIKELKQINIKENPLDYIALTNYYKFVTKERQNRSNGDDREYYISKEKEEELLINEIKFLKPKIIIFQSRRFDEDIDKYKYLFDKIKEIGIKIIVINHPSRFNGFVECYLCTAQEF